MAERLKAHVLKTCLGHTNVGSNPTPSAHHHPIVTTEVAITQNWGGARVVEWGRLLSGYRGEILGRRFESCPPRHRKRVLLQRTRFCFRSHVPAAGMIFESCGTSPPQQKRVLNKGTRFSSHMII